MGIWRKREEAKAGKIIVQLTKLPIPTALEAGADPTGSGRGSKTSYLCLLCEAALPLGVSGIQLSLSLGSPGRLPVIQHVPEMSPRHLPNKPTSKTLTSKLMLEASVGLH